MEKAPLFTGVCTALVTPFREDRVDLDALRRLIKRQLNAGVRALALAATTGESSTLSDDEWARVIACGVESAGAQAVILAGTGTNDLRHTLLRAELARKAGAQAQLVVTPYYNHTTQHGMIDYYRRVADTGLPVMLYNVPSRTGIRLMPETSAALAQHPGIIGIKEAGGDLNQLCELLRACELPVYCGSDRWNAEALRLGAAGIVSVVSNLLPGECVRLCAEDWQEARAIQRGMEPLIDALFAEVNPAPVKEALEILGLCSAEVRPPLVRVEESTRRRLQALLSQRELVCSGC